MSRTHVEILGVKIPLRGLEYVTSTPMLELPDVPAWTSAELKALFNPNPPFEAIASRKAFPITAEVNHRFFQYDTFQNTQGSTR